MIYLYNFALLLYVWLVRLVALWHKKAKLWSEGRRDIFRRMAGCISPEDRVVWVHVASLGEFEQGRPIIERVREEYPQYKILLTFFSPSGYEIRKEYSGADYIFYLPLDTPRNVRRFLDVAHPEIAIFVKYEFWLNMLSELRRRSIQTYIVSAIFRPNSIFFKPYGGLWRRALESFETIFVQNNESRELLAKLGFDNVIVAGDTRFDRVAQIAQSAQKIDLIESFCGTSPLFVAGSTWSSDEELLIELINENRDIKFVIAPHEMDEARIAALIAKCRGGAIRYTEAVEGGKMGAQLLILDTVGLLSSTYQYAKWAYIGGGFGAGIHNTLEATTFALPIAFGPKYQKFKEARDMVHLGAAHSITSFEELRDWFIPLRDDAEFCMRVSRKSKEYTQLHQGATEIFIRSVFGAK